MSVLHHRARHCIPSLFEIPYFVIEMDNSVCIAWLCHWQAAEKRGPSIAAKAQAFGPEPKGLQLSSNSSGYCGIVTHWHVLWCYNGLQRRMLSPGGSDWSLHWWGCLSWSHDHGHIRETKWLLRPLFLTVFVLNLWPLVLVNQLAPLFSIRHDVIFCKCILHLYASLRVYSFVCVCILYVCGHRGVFLVA